VINWDAHRRTEGSIDLCSAFDAILARQPNWSGEDNVGHSYLQAIEAMQAITSRQAAAQAITTAIWINEGRL
jgi:hypothetical protein